MRSLFNAVRMIALASLFAIAAVPTVEAGTVNVSWDPNPEPDVTGYIVWWGTTSGSYTGSAYLGKQTVYVFAPPNPTVTYYVMVQAYNSAGLTSPFSQEVIVPPSMQTVYPPVAVTGVASSIGATTATLNGTANPNGSATTAYFQYGPTTGYGGLTPPTSLGSGTSSIVVGGGALSGLVCGAVYHYRVLATNTAGPAAGADATFSTTACATSLAPLVTTGTASIIGATTATLSGSANPKGSATTAYFQYGVTTGYGALTPTVSLGSGTSSIAVGGGALSGLVCGTVYHYRVIATNAIGPAAGADATFSTTACATSRAPLVTTGTASSVGAKTAMLSGSVNPNGWSTTAYFQYGQTTAYGVQTPPVSLGDGMVGIPVGSTLSGLSCNTVYHFRVVATNVKGTSSGLDATLTTAACPATPPTVTTGGTSGVGATGATLNASVNPNGIATTVFFQYGRTTSYGSTTSSVSAGSGSASVTVAALASSLACGTVYHYRVVGSNTAGTTFGTDVIFTTAPCP